MYFIILLQKPKPHSELSNGKLPSKKKSISKDEVKHVKKFKTEEKKKIIIKDIFLEEKREMNVSLPPELLETSSLGLQTLIFNSYS